LGTSAGAKSGLPGDGEGMLTRFSRETAGGAGLQFEGEFPP
jgi:hypothetical protein